MIKKSRKPLNDTLANEFVYGSQSVSNPDPNSDPNADLDPAIVAADLGDESALEPEPPNHPKPRAKLRARSRAQPKAKTIAPLTAGALPAAESMSGYSVEPKTPPQGPSDLIAKLQGSAKEKTVRFTVDMPKSMHRKLSILAARTGQKKVEIVRLLLEEALQEVNE